MFSGGSSAKLAPAFCGSQARQLRCFTHDCTLARRDASVLKDLTPMETGNVPYSTVALTGRASDPRVGEAMLGLAAHLLERGP
jgi:hypothetical protein